MVVGPSPGPVSMCQREKDKQRGGAVGVGAAVTHAKHVVLISLSSAETCSGISAPAPPPHTHPSSLEYNADSVSIATPGYVTATVARLRETP